MGAYSTSEKEKISSSALYFLTVLNPENTLAFFVGGNMFTIYSSVSHIQFIVLVCNDLRQNILQKVHKKKIITC